MGNRRKSKEEHYQEVVERLQKPEEAKRRENGDPTRPDTGNERSGRGIGAGDFEAISERQREEVNELFRLVNSAGYLTVGTYDITADGEGAAVTLTAILPSSPDVPGDREQDQEQGQERED